MSTVLEVRNGLRAAVAIASGLAPGAVAWRQAGVPAADPIILLSLVSDVEVTPIRRTETPTMAGDLAVLWSTVRQWTVQVTAETVNDLRAADAVSLITQTRLGLRTELAEVALVGYLVDTTGTREHPYRVDDRVVHSWSFDAILRAEFTLADPTATGTIDHLVVTGTTENPALTLVTEVDRP